MSIPAVNLQRMVGSLVAKERLALNTAFKLQKDGLTAAETRFVLACLCLMSPLESAAKKLGWSKTPNADVSGVERKP